MNVLTEKDLLCVKAKDTFASFDDATKCHIKLGLDTVRRCYEELPTKSEKDLYVIEQLTLYINAIE